MDDDHEVLLLGDDDELLLLGAEAEQLQLVLSSRVTQSVNQSVNLRNLRSPLNPNGEGRDTGRYDTTYLGIYLPDQAASRAQEAPDQGSELGRGLGLGVHGSVRARGPSAASTGIGRSARDPNGSGASSRRERCGGGRSRIGRSGCISSSIIVIIIIIAVLAVVLK